MHETTQFLAQLIGPISFVVGCSFLIKKKFYKTWFKHLDLTQPVLFLTAIVEATAGLAIVLSHNIWNSAAAIIISLLGYAMIFEGFFALLTTRKVLKQLLKHVMSTEMILLSSLLFIVLGAYLTWVGYYIRQ